MKTISVIIPTANRPHLLDVALRSVARQAEIGSVKEIIVSENLGNIESKAICSKYPALPIKYIFRDPQLPTLAHIAGLLREADADYVAMLCDDDWWGPVHLQQGLNALEARPDASAWFAANLNVKNELEQYKIFIQRSSVVWVGAGQPNAIDVWEMNLEQMIAICWILTPFHFSTMLARREAARGCADTVETTHPWYCDRALYPRLAAFGPILYEPMPDTYIRSHDGNYQSGKQAQELRQRQYEGTKHIREFGLSNQIDPAVFWRLTLKDLPVKILREVRPFFKCTMSPDDLSAFGLMELLNIPKPAATARIAHHLTSYLDRFIPRD